MRVYGYLLLLLLWPLSASAFPVLNWLPHLAGNPVSADATQEDAPARLTAEQLQELASLPEDPIPEQRLQTAHYYKGNEYDLKVFESYIKDLKGAYIGIGPDQNFTLSAIAKAEMIFILDYDDIVVFINRIYLSFLKRGDSVDDIIALWGEKDRRSEAEKAIQEDFSKDPELKRYLKVHRKLGPKIAEHLRLSRKLGKKGERISWVADEALFMRTRAMARCGRIVVLKGNLLGDKAVKGVAAFLKKHNVPTRVVYLSNAEEYWSRYTKGFEESFLETVMDEKAVVIRTFHDTKLPKHPPQNYYHYNIQKGNHFKEWLGRSGLVRYREMMKGVSKIGKGEVSTLGF